MGRKVLLGLLAMTLTTLAMGAANAKDLVVGVPRSVPPYVIPETWGGIEYEVVRQALAMSGHRIVPKLTVLARVPKEMAMGDIDAGLTIRPETGVDACYSDPHVTYRNYVITLESSKLTIDSLADLSDKSAVAFQNAHIYLGEDYARAVGKSSAYREEANQVVQALLLYSGRIQAVVADYNIFRWYAAEVRGKVDVTQKLHLHPVFPPTEYHVAFRDPAICAQFNTNLAKLKASGEHDRIVSHYLAQMEANLAQAGK